MDIDQIQTEKSTSQDTQYFEELMSEIDQLLKLADAHHMDEIHFKPTIPQVFYKACGVSVIAVTVCNMGFAQESPEKSDLPTTSYIINRMGYSLVYDPRTRNPVYVYEKLTSNSLLGRVNRESCHFKEDKLIPEIFRSTLKDYHRSGYDRGHLAPAANHKSSYVEMSETFFLSNMCPQVPQFNRGYWSKLEKHVRDLTNKYLSVEVFTGPLYLPQEESDGTKWVKYRVIGEKDVAVPSHFYKVLILESTNKKETVAYVLPNEAIELNTPFEHFSTSIQKVEKAAGLIFYSKNE